MCELSLRPTHPGTQRTHETHDQNEELCACTVGRGGTDNGRESDEPEVAVLLVACAIGLATGAGVVLFNDIIHAIRHLAWQVGVLHP